ncbi:unnamed protein product, partial [Ixodes pacificus]
LIHASCRARLLAFAIQHPYVPPDVAALVGPLPPSRGHCLRICRILRSEAWRQIRFFKDCIHEACHREAPFDQATRRVQRELQTASRITEVQWLQILATLPKKRECRSPEGQAVHVIGNTDVPDKARRVLCLGPKFCNQPELSKPELLSMVRSTAARADAENVEGVIRDGVDCLRRSSKGISSIRTEDTISALREANLKLLLSDKEGGFAIVPDDIYNQKAAEAITSNFTLLKSYKPEKTKKEAVKMCERLNLTKLASSVRNCKGLSLEAFFSAKTHKMACPFRVIVSERGTWQRLLGHYLQKSLSVLAVEDPYLVRTPSMVSDYLQQLPKGKVLAFSVDIKDLYYSLPHDSICETVNDGIDRYGPLKFQNSVGIAAEDFLNLLMLYLRSTTVVFRSEFYRQREGVCIGSCIAPALSDLLLAFYDRLLEISLRDSSVIKIFRYVDDFLVLYRPSDDTGSKGLGDIFNTFKSTLRPFTLTNELPEEQQLRFLDLTLLFGDHVCWKYSPRSKKSFLPFSSAHSKLVKRGIAVAAIKNALHRSCHHQVSSSFTTQVNRLRKAGFPDHIICSVAERLLQESRSQAEPCQNVTKEKLPTAVIPYLHGISHSLKRTAAKVGVRVVFSAPNKLGRMCKKVNSTSLSISQTPCGKKHARQFTECTEGAVYDLPLSCGRSYIGQTGRCINDRLREHAASIGNTSGSNLVRHCSDCLCSPLFGQCTILKRHHDFRTREIVEAFSIYKRGEGAISSPSITLLAKEIEFLEE